MFDNFLAELFESKQAYQILHDDKLNATVNAFQIGEQFETLLDNQKLRQIGELRTVAEVSARF